MTTQPGEPGERRIKWLELVIVLASIAVLAVLVSPAVNPGKTSSGAQADGSRLGPNEPATSNLLALPGGQGILAASALSPRLDGSNFVGTDPGEGNPTLFLAGDGRLTNPNAIQGGLLNLPTNGTPGGALPTGPAATNAVPGRVGATTNRLQFP